MNLIFILVIKIHIIITFIFCLKKNQTFTSLPFNKRYGPRIWDFVTLSSQLCSIIDMIYYGGREDFKYSS